MTNTTRKGTTSVDTLKLVQLGVLIAIMAIFHFTGIGYIKIGLIEMTIMLIPVIIGAIVLGKTAGGILGGVFGLTSFLQCFGTSAFGTFVMGVNPIGTFIFCFVPRILAGIIVAIVFDWLRKFDKTKFLSYGLAGIAGALSNTVLFIAFMMLFFGNDATFISTMKEWQLPIENFFAFVTAFVGVNGIIEAIVCFIVGSSVAKAVVKIVPSNRGRERVSLD